MGTYPWVSSMRRRLSPHAATGFLILVACYGYFLPVIDNVNSSSRMNLVYAIADQGTIRIDDYHRNTIDKALFEGHYYTEKSIGPSIVALPTYIVFRTVSVLTGITERPEPAGDGWGYPRRYHAMALTLVTFVTVAIPSAAAAVVLYAFLRRRVSPQVAFLIMLAYGLGTIAFPYSSEFYSHQLAASSMFAAFFLLWRIVVEGARPAGAWLAGALMGLAVITEYVTVVLALLILAWVLFEGHGRSILARVIAAAIPWGLLLAGYNLAAFGTPLPVGYAYTVHFSDVHIQGFMGLTMPRWDRLYGITFSPYRGLFFLSPFLMLAGYGFYLMWRVHQHALVLLLAGITVSLLLYNASYVMWTGGVAVGARHLIPMLPFLCVPVAWAVQRMSSSRLWKPVAVALIVLSITMVWIHSISGWDFPPETVERPLTDYALPLLIKGDLALNLGVVLGLNGHASLIPLIAMVVGIAIVVPRLLARVEPHGGRSDRARASAAP
jgi:hypothetical protein